MPRATTFGASADRGLRKSINFHVSKNDSFLPTLGVLTNQLGDSRAKGPLLIIDYCTSAYSTLLKVRPTCIYTGCINSNRHKHAALNTPPPIKPDLPPKYQPPPPKRSTLRAQPIAVAKPQHRFLRQSYRGVAFQCASFNMVGSARVVATAALDEPAAS